MMFCTSVFYLFIMFSLITAMKSEKVVPSDKKALVTIAITLCTMDFPKYL